MKYSNKYQSRHGYADFNNLSFHITNKKDDTTIDCSLIKVPTYSFKHTYCEKICEGNGWYSKGPKRTQTITHDFYWLVIHDNECIGALNTNIKKSLTGKHAILNLNGLKYVKEFLKTL
jgi:hypothetical protein